MDDEPDAERRWVGVTASEKMSVTWAGAGQSATLQELSRLNHCRSYVMSSIAWTW